MGRRSRQREHASAPAAARPPAPAPPRTPRLSSRGEEAPPAPWHPFPLVELAVFAGIVLLVGGFVVGGDARPPLIFGGLVLVSVASLELSIREHFAGYRSHSGLLAAVAAVGAAALVGVTAALGVWPFKLPQEVLLVVGVVVGVVAFRWLRAGFAERSGGLTWRA